MTTALPPVEHADKNSPVCSLLLVDDNAAALKATKRLLERAGFAVATAANGAETLHQVRGLRPALVLLDVVLPDIPGPEVLQLIRADAENVDVAVVFLSAQQISPEQQALGLDAGADGYIARPIAHTELISRVRLHLRQRELTAQLRISQEQLRQELSKEKLIFESVS